MRTINSITFFFLIFLFQISTSDSLHKKNENKDALYIYTSAQKDTIIKAKISYVTEDTIFYEVDMNFIQQQIKKNIRGYASTYNHSRVYGTAADLEGVQTPITKYTDVKIKNLTVILVSYLDKKFIYFLYFIKNKKNHYKELYDYQLKLFEK